MDFDPVPQTDEHPNHSIKSILPPIRLTRLYKTGKTDLYIKEYVEYFVTFQIP